MDRESFIGLWDVYAGPTHSELLLQTDDTYVHSVWGGAQSHWGLWSLCSQAGHSLLVLELKGAQPLVFSGPFGPVPMNWPKAESWAVLEVRLNQVNFYGGLMVRRAFAIAQEMPGMGTQPAASFQLSAAQPPPAIELPQDIPAMTLPPPTYSAPPLPPPPDTHNAEVLNQWHSLNMEMYKANRQTAIDIYTAQQEMDALEFKARQQATFNMANAVRENNEAFFLKGRRK
jgi:hypothetical protein